MVIYHLSKDESKRIVFLRAICMIMVIYLHQYTSAISFDNNTVPLNHSQIIENVEYIISRIITFSAVPLYFFMSSVLLYSKEFTWVSNMKKKVRTLILPYLLWITIYILIYFVGQSLPQTSSFFANSGRFVSQMNIIDFLNAYTGYFGGKIFVNALWFLRDLIVLNLLASVIKGIIDKIPFLFMFILLILWTMVGTDKSIVLNTQSICFFSFGYYVVKYNVRMKNIDLVSNFQLICTYILSVFCEFFLYQQNNSLRITAHSISVLLGIVLVIKLSKYLLNHISNKIPKLLLLVSEYSFFIYVTHDLVQTVLKKITIKVLPQFEIIQLIEYLVIPLVTCFICVLSGIIIKKIDVKTYSLITGARDKKRG